MKPTLAILLITVLLSCTSEEKHLPPEPSTDPDEERLAESRVAIAALLDSFNVAAANADYEKYFSYFDEESIFIGTDATENWNKQEFMEWSKPYFDKGKAWNFTALERNIYFDESGTVAWFDELLDTQMKICRGSGVLTRKGDVWKIRQYVLSMTIPNDVSDSVIRVKSHIEDSLLVGLRGN